MLIRITISSITFFVTIISAFTQIIPENEALLDIRKELQILVHDSIIPSMAVAVIKNGEVIWQEAIGYADVKKQQPATINSIYPLGSVSKSITATGIMQMVNAQLLDLNQDIRALILPIRLKDINGNSPEIKLWQLVSMNAGINHGYGVYDDEKYLPFNQEEKVQFFEETTIVAFQPGTTYNYSNRAFYLSELIIENISKRPFQQYMDQHVFSPLGMNNTVVYPYQHKDTNGFVTTYSSRGLKELTPGISYPSGGSGIWSSISDMTNYALFHLGVNNDTSIINVENLAIMHNFRQGPADLFGIGWFNSEGVLISNGNVGGGNANITVDKKNKLAVICLLNKTSWDGLADQYAAKIKKVFIEEQSVSGFKEWQRFYGTPYSSRLELMGNWKGILKDPVTEQSIPIQLDFDHTDQFYLSIEGQKIKIDNPTYNLFRELEGDFRANLPEVHNETRCVFKLKHLEKKLSGYLFYDDYSEHRFYTLPLFMELAKYE